MADPVVHFEINGKDLPKLRDFYQGVFNWKINLIPEMNYCLVESTGDGGIGGGIGVTEGPGNVTFYIQVDDLDGYLRKIESRGGKTVTPPTEIPNVVTFATFEDPEGHLIGLVKS